MKNLYLITEYGEFVCLTTNTAIAMLYTQKTGFQAHDLKEYATA